MVTPASFSASACGMVRGKPSNRKPLAQSASVMRSLIRAMMMSSDTRPPLSITPFTCWPSGLPALTAARSMSPVEICGMPNFSVMNRAWVPLPAPGAPSRITRIDMLLRIGKRKSGSASWGQSRICRKRHCMAPKRLSKIHSAPHRTRHRKLPPPSLIRCCAVRRRPPRPSPAAPAPGRRRRRPGSAANGPEAQPGAGAAGLDSCCAR